MSRRRATVCDAEPPLSSLTVAVHGGSAHCLRRHRRRPCRGTRAPQASGRGGASSAPRRAAVDGAVNARMQNERNPRAARTNRILRSLPSEWAVTPSSEATRRRSRPAGASRAPRRAAVDGAVTARAQPASNPRAARTNRILRSLPSEWAAAPSAATGASVTRAMRAHTLGRAEPSAPRATEGPTPVRPRIARLLARPLKENVRLEVQPV